jgi:HEAT repeat protein
MRAILRLREALVDDSAYVRWYLLYTLGKLGSHSPSQARLFLGDLVSRLDDENRVVRSVACKAISQVAARKPLMIEEFFNHLKREIPPPVGRVLRRLKTRM